MTINIRKIKKYTQNKEVIGKAEEYLKSIEHNNDYESMFSLAQLLEGLHNMNLDEEVFELYMQASKGKTIPAALLRTAQLYKAGKGCTRSIEKSFRYAYEAVGLGNVDAEVFLAGLFKRNSKELALFWTAHAANQHHSKAAMEAGAMYDAGIGVTRRDRQKRFEKANDYYKVAAELGEPKAAGKLTAWGKALRVLRYG